jgi:hypothetical protein
MKFRIIGVFIWILGSLPFLHYFFDDALSAFLCFLSGLFVMAGVKMVFDGEF